MELIFCVKDNDIYPAIARHQVFHLANSFLKKNTRSLLFHLAILENGKHIWFYFSWKTQSSDQFWVLNTNRISSRSWLRCFRGNTMEYNRAALQQVSISHMCYFAIPVLCFHPDPCRNTELRSSGQTSAAASFSWYSAVSWASPPSALSHDPEENRAWKPLSTLREPCFWTALHGYTHWDQKKSDRDSIPQRHGISNFLNLSL